MRKSLVRGAAACGLLVALAGCDADTGEGEEAAAPTTQPGLEPAEVPPTLGDDEPGAVLDIPAPEDPNTDTTAAPR